MEYEILLYNGDRIQTAKIGLLLKNDNNLVRLEWGIYINPAYIVKITPILDSNDNKHGNN